RPPGGDWGESLVFGTAHPTPSGSTPAHIYTRRPVDASEASVRPIVQLAFRADGTCEMASASIAEDRMILALKEARRVRQPRPTEPKRIRPLSAGGSRAPIEELERPLGLATPPALARAEGFITA